MPIEVCYDLRNISVLLVEDSPFMRELMTVILDGLEIGHVVAAHHGEQAVTEIMAATEMGQNADNGFDVVISDWAMKPMSGLDLLKWVRSHDSIHIKYLPFVMLTAYSTADWVCKARDWGTTEFLTKPVSTQAVAQKLLSVIERPRPFVRSINYFGPDRRRHGAGGFSGQNRRRS
jgi:two-component system chemotaxis response regulator CheY